ncbi:unnamed protein product [Rhodiola kirilowii]
MQIAPFNEPIAAVPILAVAPGWKFRNDKKKFDLPPGWTEQVTVRTAGKLKGRKDKFYFGPDGMPFCSRTAVKKSPRNRLSCGGREGC